MCVFFKIIYLKLLIMIFVYLRRRFKNRNVVCFKACVVWVLVWVWFLVLFVVVFWFWRTCVSVFSVFFRFFCNKTFEKLKISLFFFVLV